LRMVFTSFSPIREHGDAPLRVAAQARFAPSAWE
jgi:hypothetical protein